MVTDREGYARVDYPGGTVVRPRLGHSVTSGNKPFGKEFLHSVKVNEPGDRWPFRKALPGRGCVHWLARPLDRGRAVCDTLTKVLVDKR